jgi:hypothetical protein
MRMHCGGAAGGNGCGGKWLASMGGVAKTIPPLPRNANKGITMKSFIKSLALVTLTTSLVAGLACHTVAQDKPPAKKDPAAQGTGAGKSKSGSLPFKGKIDAVDTVAKTVKVGDKTYQVTSTTKFMKDGKPATFSEAKMGEEVGGAYKTADGGKLELVSLRIGPKPATDGAPPAKEKKTKDAAPATK